VTIPAVTAVIPTHNRAWCVAGAVESVLAQDFSGFELIVVDDGSTDNTPQVLAAYPAIQVLCQKNRGVSAARNLGAARARGKWLAFLDSDDLWLPQKLSAQLAFFREHPEYLICQTQETWEKNGQVVRPLPRHAKPSGMAFERMTGLCLVSPSAVMLERELFMAHGGFDETLPACEDYDLWLRLGREHPMGLVDLPLVKKRGGHKDQLSALPGLDLYRVRSLARIIREGGLTARQLAAARRALAEKASVYAAGCEKRGRSNEARQILLLAAGTDGGDPESP